MLTNEYIAQTLERIKARPFDERVHLVPDHPEYKLSVEAIKWIIDRRIDRAFGFELLFIAGEVIPRKARETDFNYETRRIAWFAEARRIPGKDYQPIAFRKTLL